MPGGATEIMQLSLMMYALDWPLNHAGFLRLQNNKRSRGVVHAFKGPTRFTVQAKCWAIPTM